MSIPTATTRQPGRPISGAPETCTLCIRLVPDMIAWLDGLASAHNRSRANTVAMLLDDALKSPLARAIGTLDPNAKADPIPSGRIPGKQKLAVRIPTRIRQQLAEVATRQNRASANVAETLLLQTFRKTTHG